MIKKTLILTFLVLAGCSGMTSQTQYLYPTSNSCVSNEVHDFWAVNAYTICYDNKGKPITELSGNGMPPAAVASSIANAAVITSATSTINSTIAASMIK